MTRHAFGGGWTEEKLDRVRRYLIEYTKIFAKNPSARRLATYYVDAFAGTGYRSAGEKNGRQQNLFAELESREAQSLKKGSARIALEVEPSFKHYLFIERNPEYALELERLRDRFPDKAHKIEIVHEEANSYLKRWCEGMGSYSRAVVFLDPYGMQVDWSLIEAIASTQKIDLWLLFPLGSGVSRLLTKGKPPPKRWSARLTEVFGSEDWKHLFYKRGTQRTLFGDESICEKTASFDNIAQFFVDRLKTVFAGVVDKPLPLMNSKNIPLYLLCFAAGNPRGASTALKIANYLLKS